MLEHGKILLLGGSIEDWTGACTGTNFENITEHSSKYSVENGLTSSTTLPTASTTTVPSASTTQTQPVKPDDERPWRKSATGWFSDRMEVREFNAVIEVLSSDCANVS